MHKFLLFFWVLMLPASAFAYYDIDIEDDGRQFKMSVDRLGNAHFKGLLDLGDVYYSSRKAVLYYKPKDQGRVYALATTPLARGLDTYHAKKEPSASFRREMGFGVDEWLLSFGGIECHRLLGSQEFSSRVAFSMIDFNRLRLGLAYLMGDKLRGHCDAAGMPRAVGAGIGFPMREITLRHGQKAYKVMTIKEIHEPDVIAMPEVVEPLTAEVHMAVMKSRLTQSSLSAYLRTEQRLKGSDQLKINALRNLLEAQGKRIRVAPPEGFDNGLAPF